MTRRDPVHAQLSLIVEDAQEILETVKILSRNRDKNYQEFKKRDREWELKIARAMRLAIDTYGATMGDIAAHIGVGKATVYRILRAHGLTYKQKGLSRHGTPKATEPQRLH